MTEERLEFLKAFVLGSDAAKELFEYMKARVLSRSHTVSEITPYGIVADTNGINAIRDMAVLEFIQQELINPAIQKQTELTKENDYE